MNTIQLCVGFRIVTVINGIFSLANRLSSEHKPSPKWPRAPYISALHRALHNSFHTLFSALGVQWGVD